MSQRAVSQSLEAHMSASQRQTTPQQGLCCPQPFPISSTPAAAASLPAWATAACCAWAFSFREMADLKACPQPLQRPTPAHLLVVLAAHVQPVVTSARGEHHAVLMKPSCGAFCERRAILAHLSMVPLMALHLQGALSRVPLCCRNATAISTGHHQWRVCNGCLQLPVLCQEIGVLGIHCCAT